MQKGIDSVSRGYISQSDGTVRWFQTRHPRVCSGGIPFLLRPPEPDGWLTLPSELLTVIYLMHCKLPILQPG